MVAGLNGTARYGFRHKTVLPGGASKSGERMTITETIGMMSTGALLAILGIYVYGPDPVAPAPQIVVAPAAMDGAGVTRGDVDLGAVRPVEQIETIVALSQAGIGMDADLTEEQREVIAFFEDTARKMNEDTQERSETEMYFSNMAVSDLTVRYFYKLPGRYETLNAGSIMASQAQLVKATLCNGAAIQTLMTDYGFVYSYTYLSGDNRKIGEVTADAATCA